MKKTILSLLILLTITEISNGQVVTQKKSTTSTAVNSNAKKIAVQADQTKTAISNTPIANIHRADLVPLNSNSPAYKRYLSSNKRVLIPGYNSPVYSKQYAFADGTKMKISVGTPANVVILRKSNLANPQPISKSSTDDGQNECTSVKLELTADSKTFMNNNYSGQAHSIYPGAIYNSNDLFNGNFKEVNNGRNPVVLTVDNHNMTGNSYEVVQNPNAASLQNSVTQLWQRFTTDDRNTAQEAFTQNVYEAATASDMAIKMGVDASGYGGTFSAYYGTQKDQKTEYLTIDCIKPMFTVSVALPDSGYFNKNANVNLSNLVVIGSVTYGSRVLANLKALFNSASEEAGFSAGYSGWGLQAHANLDFFSSYSAVQNTINAYYVGGPASTKPSFNKPDLEGEITKFYAGSNYQNSVPISYQLYDLNGNNLGVISATDAFNVPLCIPKDLSNASLDCSGDHNDNDASFAYVKTGNGSDDNKDPDTHWSFGLMDNNGNHVASFHDDSNNDPYGDGTTTDKLFLKTENPATYGSFVVNGAGGGRIHINIAPKGHDTWNIDEFTVFLGFTNPNTAPQKLTWTGINLNEGHRDVDLSFQYNKTQNAFTAIPYSQ